MNLYGLIGFPLTHSFSKKYFTSKFEKENIKDSKYELFEIADASLVVEVIKNNPDLKGLNVTIPHKENVIKYLNEIDPAAEKIGAVNVIKIKNGKLKGFNSDYYGFRQSLLNVVSNVANKKAIVLGTGGAAKAVKAALEDLSIEYFTVSRKKEENMVLYSDLNKEIISTHQIIINTTPLGMYPNIDSCPEIPYEYLTSQHYLFDLVYNPEETLFMKKGIEGGAKAVNGLEMLHLQAEKAWEIWQSQQL
jgi:shikimate dehydrogenase